MPPGEVLAELETTELEQQVAQAEQASLPASAANLQQHAAGTESVRGRGGARGGQPRAIGLSSRAAEDSTRTRITCCWPVATCRTPPMRSGVRATAYQAIANNLRGWLQAEIKARKAMLTTAQNAYEAEVARCNLAEKHWQQ